MPRAGRRGRGGILAGAVSVGSGVLVTGVCTYLFLSVTGRVLGPARFAPISTLWSLIFIVGPGLFMPLQQEVGRVVAARREQRAGRDALRKAMVIAVGLSVLTALVAAAASPWLVSALFHDEWALFWCFELAVAGYAASFLARGVFSGAGDYRDFASLLIAESVVRLVFAGALAAADVHRVSLFAVAIAIAPLVSTLVVTRAGARLRLAVGPSVAWGELTAALGWLVIGSMLAQFLANAGPIAVQLLATPSQQAEAGRFLSALVIARVSLYLFQAIQATLIPNLSDMTGRGQSRELRAALRRLVLAILGLVVVSTLAALAAGPLVVRLLFGSGFDIGHVAMAMLACASSVYVLAAALNGAAIAAGYHYLSAVAWSAGAIAFVLGTLSVDDLFLRVEVGYLAGACAAALALSIGLPRAARSGVRHETEDSAVLAAPPAE